MWDRAVPFQRKWSKHECLLHMLRVTICPFKDAIFVIYFQQTGLLLIL